MASFVHPSTSEFAVSKEWSGEARPAISNQAATPAASHPLHALSTKGSRRDARPSSRQGAEADRAAPASGGRQDRAKRSPADGRLISLISHEMSG
jgi:hypothetical protein